MWGDGQLGVPVDHPILTKINNTMAANVKKRPGIAAPAPISKVCLLEGSADTSKISETVQKSVCAPHNVE